MSKEYTHALELDTCHTSIPEDESIFRRNSGRLPFVIGILGTVMLAGGAGLVGYQLEKGQNSEINALKADLSRSAEVDGFGIGLDDILFTNSSMYSEVFDIADNSAFVDLQVGQRCALRDVYVEYDEGVEGITDITNYYFASQGVVFEFNDKSELLEDILKTDDACVSLANGALNNNS